MTLVVRATTMKNNFGRYLQHAVDKGEVIIEKNGRPVAKLVALGRPVPADAEKEKVFVSDRLVGVLRMDGTADYKTARNEALETKYGRSD